METYQFWALGEAQKKVCNVTRSSRGASDFRGKWVREVAGKLFWAEGWKVSFNSMLSASLLGKGKRKRKCFPFPTRWWLATTDIPGFNRKQDLSYSRWEFFSEEELVLSVDHYTANAADGNLRQSIIFASAAVFSCSISASLPTCTEVTIHPQPVHNWPVASLNTTAWFQPSCKHLMIFKWWTILGHPE